jgi:hypothetical protein
MRDTLTMIESLPATAADAVRLARRPIPFDAWRRPVVPAPLEKPREGIKPEPLYAPVPQPPDPDAERPGGDVEPKPQRGVAIYDL